MNGAQVDQLRQGLTPPHYVEQPTGEGSARVWVPRSSVPGTPEPAHQHQQVPASPLATAPAGLVVSVGEPGRQLSAPTGLQAQTPVARTEPTTTEPTRNPGPDGPAKSLPEGVLARVSNGMALAIATVAGVAMAEAAFNLGRFVFTILALPLPLAIGFPAIFEAAAASFAVQDMRDRRSGHASRAMRVATYLTLVASSLVNGVVGWVAHGGAGLIEILPPLVLAAVIHLHGDRATRAHESQAVLRPAWQEAQLKRARRESVLDVLPLLAGDDVHGKATVDLLTRRLKSETLSPGEALIAAGWHDRQARIEEASPEQAASMLRRLETIAATVWGDKGPPASPVPATIRPPVNRVGGSSSGSTHRRPGSTKGSTPGSSNGSTGRSGGSSSGSSVGSTPRSNGGSSTRSTGSKRSIQELRARSIEDLIAEVEDAVRAGALNANSTITAVREHLQVHPDRARALHKHLQERAATPPHPRVLTGPDQATSATQGSGDSTGATVGQEGR
jgi:hypothetical protein